MSFLLEFDSPPWRVVVDDDDRVAYAYLLRDGEAVGDVWLYNRHEAPEEPEWHDKSNVPFLNPRRFARQDGFVAIETDGDVAVDWRFEGEHLARVDVRIRGVLSARLAPFTKPGWSRMAVADGPLARVLM